jgi:tetratricopeptide (TPR) repeat protein
MDKETLRQLESGREHYENREYDKAEEYLLKVAQTASNFADVMNMLGVINHDKGEVGIAQEFFEKAVTINPRYTEAALNLAVTYNEQGQYEDAKRIFAHVATLKDTSNKAIEPFARGKLANMHADLGRAYTELQLTDKALVQYREALLLCPNFVDIRTRLGQIMRDVGDIEGAREEFEKVKAQNPKYLPARISLGVTYFALADREAAKTEWEAAMEVDPQNKTAGMYLRMVDQLLAQEEAEIAGVPLEVEATPSDAASAETEDDLVFTFEGRESDVEPISMEVPADEAGPNNDSDNKDA